MPEFLFINCRPTLMLIVDDYQSEALYVVQQNQPKSLKRFGETGVNKLDFSLALHRLVQIRIIRGRAR
jgi:hypothetical protein